MLFLWDLPRYVQSTSSDIYLKPYTDENSTFMLAAIYLHCILYFMYTYSNIQ